MGSPIIGPPFSSQMLPSVLPEGLEQHLAAQFNRETVGDQYITSFNQTQTISTSSTLPPITPANTSSSAYLQAISEAKQGFKEILDYNDKNQSLLNISRWKDNVNFMNSLAALQTAMRQLSRQETQFSSNQRNQLTTYNSAVTAYNAALGAVSGQAAAMREIQNNFLNGTITEAEYNAQVASWNASVVETNATLSSAYTTYLAAANTINSQITANNQAAEQINNIRTGMGIQETIPQQQLIPVAQAPSSLPTNLPNGTNPPSIPANYLVPTSFPNVPTVSTRGTGWQGSATSYMKNFYTPIFEQELPAFLSYSEGLERQGAYRSLLAFTLAGKTATNIAYVDRFPKAPSNAAAASPNPAGGVALMAASLGLSNHALSGAISQNSISPILSEILKGAPEEVQNQILENASIVVLKALQRSSLYTGAAALDLIANNLEAVSPGSAATEAAIGLAGLKTLTGLIGSGALEQNMASAVGALLEGAQLTKEQASLVIKALTSGATLGVLLMGVLNLAKSLELPGLVGQFLGQQSLNGMDINKLIGQATINNINTALQNPVTVLYLKDFLSKELMKEANASLEADASSKQAGLGAEVEQKDIVDQGVKNQQITTSATEAKMLADSIINKAIENRRIQTSLELKDAIASSLRQENYAENLAQEIANRASDFLQSELSLPGLDTSFNDNVYRRQSLQSSAFLNEDVRPVLRNDYSFETVRDFRDQLSSDLVNNGISPDKAYQLSNTAAATIQTADLRRIIEGQSLDRERLERSIAESLQSQGVPQESAHTIALNTATATISGQYPSETSLRNSITTSLTEQGIDEAIAQKTQSSTIVVPADVNVLKTLGNGNILSQEQLVAQLTSDITKKLKSSLGPQEAANLANLGVLTLFGPDESPQEKSINDVKENLSVKKQFQEAFDTFLSVVDNKKTQDVVISRFADQFKEHIKGTFDAFDLAQRFANPANNLVLCSAWGLMYSGVSGEPSNFKKDIDIRI